MKKFINFINEEIDPFVDDNWEDEESEITKYYYGQISFDQIEIYPSIIENSIILRKGDYEKLGIMSSVSKEFLQDYGFFMFLPRMLRGGKLFYIYERGIDIELLREQLKTSIMKIGKILPSFRYNDYMNIIRHDDNIYYDGDGWSIINLI